MSERLNQLIEEHNQVVAKMKRIQGSLNRWGIVLIGLLVLQLALILWRAFG